jgi:hypothetical protein
MFLSGKKDTPLYGVLFEVGSGSVAGAIVSSSPTAEQPVVLYATREFLSLKQTSQTEDISKRLLSTFMTVAMDVEAKIPQYVPKKTKLHSVCVNFTAPWSHTRGNTHTYQSEEPVLITEKLLTKIKDTTTKKLSEEALSHNVLKDGNYTLINRTIIGHTANSYPIQNPIGQTIKTLTTTETISAVINTMYLPVQDMVKKLFPNTKIQFSTSSLLQQHLLQAQPNLPSTFATIHLSHEALELTLYRDNEITTAYTAPIGLNTIARNIAKASKLPHEQIFSYLTAGDATLYQESALKKIENAFEASVLTPLEEFFSTTQSFELLPKDFYLATTLIPSPALMKIFTAALKKSSNNRFVLNNICTPLVHNTAKANLCNNDLGVFTLAYFFHNNAFNN